MVKILVGDCRKRLTEIQNETVQLCITSPPYYGLRNYGTKPLVWGGRGDCEHAWTTESTRVQAGGAGAKSVKQVSNTGSQTAHTETALCIHCQAWRGDLGLEPTLEMYVEHLVEIFREARRVLRNDGVLVLNLGDSYANDTKWGGSSGGKNYTSTAGNYQGQRVKRNTGLKPKDLMGIPWRVALALQADGWYLRSAMPWLKASAMPESVRDRPTTAHEYVFLLSKSKKYYWDAEAIRVGSQVYHRKAGGYDVSRGIGDGTGGQDGRRALGFKERDVTTVGRNYRTTDAYIAPLEHAIQQAEIHILHTEHVTKPALAAMKRARDTDGLLLDEEGNPVALRVNPGNFKGAHFATFPTGLVEPFVKAGSSEKGACPECGSPWVRVVKRTKGTPKSFRGSVFTKGKTNDARAPLSAIGRGERTSEVTTGWTPSCACPPSDPVPQTVLDIFGGAMTTMMVADRLGRDGIACELSPDYAEMGRQRLVDDGGMFTQVSVD